jgi:hypothetical protein
VAALRALCRQTRAALTARRNRSHDDTITDGVPRDARAEGLDNSHGLVANDQPLPDRILALEDVHVGSADRRERDLDERFTDARFRTGNLAKTYLRPSLGTLPLASLLP